MDVERTERFRQWHGTSDQLDLATLSVEQSREIITTFLSRMRVSLAQRVTGWTLVEEARNRKASFMTLVPPEDRYTPLGDALLAADLEPPSLVRVVGLDDAGLIDELPFASFDAHRSTLQGLDDLVVFDDSGRWFVWCGHQGDLRLQSF